MRKVRCIFYLTIEQRETLRLLAKDRKKTMADFLRDALDAAYGEDALALGRVQKAVLDQISQEQP